ncbi:hypothetical protein [Flectobacillus sp. BAB-3569]|uniref:hypothetical protein n=1 Tax=Flectobacillus sp. BAB-3569 TaxID=1509483 RepID=UPI000BA49D85|nr:hypothetical protein [Flectobacillus sp. BAB-3569]PAC32593.1 hypothetical protein BWI92_05175 [Flectobacillus sp. BAB-3569]
MPNEILFVFEGEKTEKQIVDNLTQYFISENSIIQCAYCSEVYQLYKELSADEDLDMFMILKEIPRNKEILSRYSRNDFAEIYLFFDYDGHSTLANDSKLESMLRFFNEETSVGKLYISYPMVEALKHIQDEDAFRYVKVLAKKNIHYKNIVSQECKKEFVQFTSYNRDIWIILIKTHLQKLNDLINDDYIFPNTLVSQEMVFQQQLEKYINVDSTVSVLSSFPIFLLDYYGVFQLKILLKYD